MRTPPVTLLGTPVRAHALLPLTALLAWRMGMGPEALALAAALLPHELAHLAAARGLGMRTQEIVLTPLGAAIRVESLWGGAPWRMAAVALAGPAASLLLLLGAAAAGGAWPALRFARPWLLFLRADAALFLVNCLPALPLDGGRALCAMLAARTGPGRAARIGAAAGCALAGSMAALAVWMGARWGVWNLSLLIGAVYIAACALQEPREAVSAAAEALVLRREELRRAGALPVREMAVPAGTSVSRALRELRPGRVVTFCLMDRAMRCLGRVGEERLLAAIPDRAGESLLALLEDRAEV